MPAPADTKIARTLSHFCTAVPSLCAATPQPPITHSEHAEKPPFPAIPRNTAPSADV